jgi:hypothetical protein
MTSSVAPSSSAPSDRAARLTRWSWLMVVLFFVDFVVAAVLGTVAVGWLGLAEGELLTAAGLSGWAVVAGLAVVELAPAVAGSVLGWRAVQAGGGAMAASALVANLVLGLYAAAVQAAQLLMG